MPLDATFRELGQHPEGHDRYAAARAAGRSDGLMSISRSTPRRSTSSVTVRPISSWLSRRIRSSTPVTG